MARDIGINLTLNRGENTQLYDIIQKEKTEGANEAIRICIRHYYNTFIYAKMNKEELNSMNHKNALHGEEINLREDNKTN